MKIRRLLIGALLVPVIACGQFIGSEDVAPWKNFKLNPKTTISLNFRNANVDAVIGLLSKTSGVTIVKDPSLTGNITVTSAKPVSLSDAFQILSTTLSLKGYRMSKEGNLLVIKNTNQGRNGGGGMFGGLSQEQIQQMMQNSGGGEDRTELRVFPITYANASQLARVLNDIFENSGQQNQNRFQMMFQQGGRNNGRNPFQAFNRGGRNSSQSNVHASSDDFSNSVIVNAPGNMMDQISTIIGKLDKQTEDPQSAKVYKLNYATASLLAPTVQNVLTANAPKGRGGISGQNVPIEQRFQQAFRFGSTQAAFGTVVADDRTNSLVVTATDDNQKLVAKVIDELDQDVPIENTTFVFPLANAKAEDVAGLMQQAFGTRQTGGNRGFGNTGNFRNNNNNNRNNRNNNNNRNRLNGLQGNEVDQDGRNLDLALEDPNADSGELMTNVGVQVGGFFQRGNTNQNQTGQMGRDAQGRPVNIRDLQNQITVIPDPNTNSLIVVTTPENVQLLQSILDQLDKIPEQVMIETMIIEATLDASNQFGVEWNLVQSKAFGNSNQVGNAGTGFGLENANPALQGFKYTLTGGDLGVFLNALKTDTKFQVLSTPRIFTSNNVQAEINISQSVPYVTSSRQSDTGVLTFTYDFQDVGIVLTVTPHITANGYVTMDVDQTANDLQGFTDFNAPIVNQRQATTTVSVKDGETIILGGIIRRQVNSTVKKIPLLGDIPILGQLFRSSTKQDVKTELMVFLTPRVVKNEDEARKLREDTTKQLTPPSQKTLQNSIPPPKGDGHKSPPGGG